MTKEHFIRSNAFEAAARIGFVARGVVYGLIGAFAVALAVGAGGKATSQQGALETVAHQPLGHALVVAIAVGLGGYALWRVVRASLGRGPEDGGDTLIDRVGGFGSGIFYAFLCVVAVEVAIGSTHGNGAVSHKTAGVLGWPLGREIVTVAGVVLVVVGLYQGWRGLSRDFLDDAKVGKMSRRMRRFLVGIGVVGHVSRMVVFGLVGSFLIKAAVEYDPRTAVGIGGALSKLLHQPAGNALLGVVAAGLLAFGIFSMTDARYHRL